jgi:hypothetical protein
MKKKLQLFRKHPKRNNHKEEAQETTMVKCKRPKIKSDYGTLCYDFYLTSYN